ncbi:MAG TPA: hypothetical protein VK369_03550 [Segetibacter sp.]|nr:hypothetical protein [Segetibacter sp.]
MVGQNIVQKVSSPETQEQAKGFDKPSFKTTFGVLGDLYVVLFPGIFFTRVLTRTKQTDA